MEGGGGECTCRGSEAGWEIMDEVLEKNEVWTGAVDL